MADIIGVSPNKVGNQSGTDNANYFSSPVAASLPKGGGAIRSIGEKFSVNPVTGTGGVTVPVFTTVSRSDFYPKLSLNYDSGGGNGSFGLSWNLSVPSITRKTDKGLPRYDDAAESDIFILSGSEDLVPVLKADGTRSETPRNGYSIRYYRPRIEGLFARIERWTKLDSGEIHWRSLSKDNVTSIYGKTAALHSRIADPDHPTRVFKWLLEASYDDRGNLIVYEYKQENSDQVPQAAVSEKNRLFVPQANVYLKRIKYGNITPYKQGEGQPAGDIATLANSDDWLFQVVFDYGEHDPTKPTPEGEINPWGYRSDAFSNYRAGFEVRTRRLCQRVLMFHRLDEAGNIGADWQLVRSTKFGYDPHPVATYLTSATQVGYSQETPAGRSYPALEFRYDRPAINNQIKSIDPKSLKNLPIGLDGSKYQWVDLDSEGISGILTEQATGWLYKRNLGEAHFDTAGLVATKPSIANLSNSQQRLMDLAGDGTLDLVSLGKLSGYYERRKSGEWRSFVPFECSPTVNWNDPNLRFIDVTGDGHADILIAEQEMFIWYPSKAREGFGAAVWVHKLQDEEKGPTLLFADPLQSVFLSDMTGDGLTDIVRIRNGEVCYWPNLGYGQFGAKVTLAGSPQFAHPELFDPKRIRLADIDGSGTTDIIYLGRGELHVWFNQAGNSLRKHGSSDGERPLMFPPMDNLAAVQTIDLLGNGTACIVWSSSLPGVASQPMYYIDLMGGQKPHLMRSMVNNMGGETKFQYAASTKFYLKDREAGKPWITRLPFPVHVLERVETLDQVSGNRLVTSYRYSHGYFDGVEREFRGFGYVEQIDTEEFGKFQAGGGTNALAAGLHVPPVVTKTWFHTGAYFEGAGITKQYEQEYYRLDPAAGLLQDTVLPNNLIGDEGRQACRALKGQMLRQEVYALDGSDRSQHPYMVTESNYQIRKVQPMGAQRYGVFFTHPRESLVYHYERNPAAPRIAHQMTLEVDEFGNVLKSAAIAYPRRSAVLPEQQQVLITYTDNQVTNKPEEQNWYRIGVPIQTRTYEIKGLSLPQKIDQLRAALEQAAEIFYEDPYKTPPSLGAGVQKRLIEQVKTLYRSNNQANSTNPTPLRLGVIDSLALPCESFKLAFTSGLLTQVYGDKIPAGQLDALLGTEGGYFKDSGGWWIPSGRQAFDPAKFYLPVQMQDPFGKVYQTTYDQYPLLPISTIDPLQNEILIQNNYRLMQPQQITDPNGNRSQARFDALGMVVGTAVMGKETTAAQGDALTTFKADLSATELQAFFEAADPRSLAIEHLGTATTRFIYDLTHTPVCAAAIARKKHISDLAGQPLTPDDVQVSFVYSDGFSREAQTKIQAEPGPLDLGDATSPLVNPRWVGTGTKVYNNKGKPVRQFEPFFSRDHKFGVEQHGVSSTLFYDPVERVVATLHPNHTYEKVVFDAWEQETWDVNDTVTLNPKVDPDVGGFLSQLPEEDYLPTWYQQRAEAGAMETEEKDAAKKAKEHANTPTITHFDTLGRTFLTIADNGAAGKYETRTELDIEGNQRSVMDAKNRVVMIYDYDLLSNVIRQSSMEAGERWMLNNVAGKPMRQWDTLGFVRRLTYDPLQRPLELFVATAGQGEKLAERTVYGEAQGTALNHLGKVYQVFDGAGVVTHQAYDFKGNLLGSARQLLQNYRDLVDWARNPRLEAETFASSTIYDALNRPVAMTMPDRSVMRPTYNEANLLERMEVNLQGRATATSFVTDVDYNAKGQRVLIAYGNGVRTQYEYDEQTFRLIRLLTLRGSEPLQDLRYTYDPVGNITWISDNAQQDIFFRNERVSPGNKYTYDAIYRLIEAEGREHIGQVGQPETSWNDEFRVNLPHPGDRQAMRDYTERYSYDAVGNFDELVHLATNGNWSRTYDYQEDSLVEPGGTQKSNRLSKTTVGSRDEGYTYDAHGNMITMPHLKEMIWDFKDQLQSSQQQVVNDGIGERTFYVYDSTGQRVRKLTEGQSGGRRKERIYLGGYEVYREYGVANSRTLERETLQVMDDQQRIALVETRTQGTDGSPQRLIRFQLGNHLGSASLEVDDSGQVISYEEYYPYGSTSCQAVEKGMKAAAKRYRYTGKERDEESGLYYHGARYYAPWLGRWTSCDPIGIKATLNGLAYGRNNPIRFFDPTGMADYDWPKGASFISPENTGTGGTLAHKEVLPELKNRIDQAGSFSAGIEVKTLPGGSKKPGSIKSGEMDLLLKGNNTVDKINELKAFGSKQNALKETQHYARFSSSPSLPNDQPITDYARNALEPVKSSNRTYLLSQDPKSPERIDYYRYDKVIPKQPEVKVIPKQPEIIIRRGQITPPNSTAPVSSPGEAAQMKSEIGIKSGINAEPNSRIKPNGEKLKGSKAGYIFTFGIALYTLYETKSVYAAAQTANPVANTTDTLFSGDFSKSSIAKSVVEDIFNLTPLATLFAILKPSEAL